MSDYQTLCSDTTATQFATAASNALKIFQREIRKLPLSHNKGKVIAVNDSAVHAHLPGVTQGQLCHIQKNNPLREGHASAAEDDTSILAEVTSVAESHCVLQPYVSTTAGISCNDWAIPLDSQLSLMAGDYLKGAIVDALGNILSPSLRHEEFIADAEPTPLFRQPPNALKRPLIDQPLPVGIRSIDTLLTVGKGQRLGIFSPAGVGKSTLMGMMAKFASADVIVLGLVGERGREVNEFLSHVLTEDARQNCVVVVSTSDRPAIEKVKAIYTATAIAEHFRDRGQNVLLMVDSLTRFARAQRDVAIAAGEHIPPNGFPASMFAPTTFATGTLRQ